MGIYDLNMNNINGNFIRICVCGEGGVGKTSFLNKVLNNVFDEDSDLTKGVEFFNKKIRMIHHTLPGCSKRLPGSHGITGFVRSLYHYFP